MMYGVPLPLLLRVGHVILLFLWMIFPNILGFISSKIVLNFIKYILTLPKCLKHSFLNLSKFSDMIMPKNIKPMNLPLFSINLVLFLIPLVLTFLRKMVELSANFVIFLLLFMLLLLPLLLLLSFGGKLPSPSVHNQTPYGLLFGSSPSYDLLRVFGCVCFVLLQDHKRNKLQPRSRLFFLGMELVKKVISVVIPLENVFVFLSMWSFRNKMFL